MIGVEGMYGLGDNLYQRGVIAALREQDEVAVRTPWPEVYAGLDVKFMFPQTDLRTQAENLKRLPQDFWWRGRMDRRVRLSYDVADFQAGRSIPAALSRGAGVDIRLVPLVSPGSELPRVVPEGRALGIVHPPTVRREWYNAARPCDPKYLQLVIDAHPELFWVEVGWNKEGEEWYAGEPPRVDASFMGGELSMNQLLTLWGRASLVVSGVGFPLPLGIVMQTPTLILYGGDVPDYLLTAGYGHLPLYRCVEPDQFCACYGKRHGPNDCNKVLDEQEILQKAQELLAPVAR